MTNPLYFSSAFKLGILGGGQLGKMLLSDTRRYDITTKVMDPSGSAPCRIGSNEFVQGSLNDYQTVLDFGTDCDVLTIEIENVNTDALHELQNQGVKVFPKPETLELIKNKVLQKNFYQKKNIPTAPFFSFTKKAQMEQELAKSKLSFPFVWKAATGGYDGKGVSIVKTENDLSALPDCEGLIEELIPFEKELAVVCARSEKGEITSYPMVEMDFHPTANLVEYVFSPSLLDQNIQTKAKKIAEDICQQLNHVGLLAVEMFYTATGDVLINEIAPRVHNSGHLSIEGNNCSQFDMHLRAILNLPLGNTDIVLPSVMINLTGEEGFEGPVRYEGVEKIMALSGVHIHLYGKAETRPFRKMGHITITAPSLEEARAKAKIVKETIKVKSQ